MNSHGFWRRLESWLPALIIGLGLVLWEWFSRTGRLSALFFPAPSTIVASLIQMILNGKMAIHLKATAERLAIGFAIGGSAGLLLGLAMGWSSRLRQIIDPLIAAIHPIPKIAIFPLIMIVFGIGEASKIVAISIASFFPMLINCMSGVRQLNPVYFEVTQNYRASRWKTFSRLVVPGSLPLILTGARLAINMAMVIAIAVELLAAKEGLGVIIWFSWQTLRIEELYASLVVIALLGIGINLFLQYLSKRLTPWYSDQTDRQY
jgi:NitT/TauT family transport system permease protein